MSQRPASSASSTNGNNVADIEKGAGKPKADFVVDSADSAPVTGLKGLFRKVLTNGTGLEVRGASPVPYEERKVTRYFDVFSLWFCLSVNLLPITFGMVGTLVFGLGLRDAFLVIFFITLLCTLAPAYLATLGPKTGMRQMIQARFSFGRYLVGVPVLLNLATLTGFCVIICVVGGQCISAVSSGTVTPNIGIVIIALLSLGVSFCGFHVLHMYERWAWVPAVIALVIATGCGGNHLKDQAPVEPATAPMIMSFAGLIASFMIPWAALASDFTTYIEPVAPSWRIGLYTYAGLALPTIPLMTLGAAMGGAVSNVESWLDGYNKNLVGGVLAAMLEPAGGFGKFVTVVLAFTLLGNLAATQYSITINFQILIPWMVRIPRYIFAIVITAIIIPVSIRAAVDFFLNLENFVGLIGYWSAAFVGIVVTEHLFFRKGDCDSYDHAIWNDARKLPLGIAALGASALSFGLVIPCMSQVWFTGPIAKTTGDLGFEIAVLMSALLYLPLRATEKKFTGR